MPYDFPAAPAVGDKSNGYVYAGNGIWDVEAAAPTGDFVLKAGDTMGGVLTLINPDPAAPLEATHKRYVDETIAANSLYQGTWSVAANTPDITPSAAILHSYSWIAVTVDPAVPETAPAALPGIGGTLIAEGDNVIWNETLALYQLVRGEQAVAGDFVLKTGDTMSGPLNFALSAPIDAIKFTTGGWNGAWIKYANTNGMEEGSLEFWTGNGGWNADWVFKTTVAQPPGINVNGGGSFGGQVLMREGAGLHWGNTNAGTDPLDFSEGICLYGIGTSSKFGFTITGGTLNYVVEQTGNFHIFRCGAAEKFRVHNSGVTVSGNIGLTGSVVNNITIAKAAPTLYLKATDNLGQGIYFTDNADAQRFSVRVDASNFHINTAGIGNSLTIAKSDGTVSTPYRFSTANYLTCTGDGYGVTFYDGCRVFKKVGGGGILRETSANTRWGIENGAGVWQGYVSKQSTRDVGTVEELISNAVKPLLTKIAALEARLAKAKL